MLLGRVGLFLSELLFRVVFYVAANPVYISPWRPSCSSRYPSSIPWCSLGVSCNPSRDDHFGRHWSRAVGRDVMEDARGVSGLS